MVRGQIRRRRRSFASNKIKSGHLYLYRKTVEGEPFGKCDIGEFVIEFVRYIAGQCGSAYKIGPAAHQFGTLSPAGLRAIAHARYDV